MKTTLTVLTLGLGLLAGCNNEPFGMAVNLHVEPVKAAQASEVIETGRIDPSLPVASDVFKSGVDIKMSQTVADNQPCLSVGACE
jgi:hypothetical protein